LREEGRLEWKSRNGSGVGAEREWKLDQGERGVYAKNQTNKPSKKVSSSLKYGKKKIFSTTYPAAQRNETREGGDKKRKKY